jgi:hypothetical protein
MAITEDPAEGRDMDPEIALFDERIRPDAGDQLLFGHELAGAVDQSNQNIERAAAEAHGLIPFQEELLCRKQPKRSERNGGPERRRSPISHWLAPLIMD